MNSRILPFIVLLIAIGIFFVYVQPMWVGPIAEIKIAIANDDQALVAAGEYVAQQNELASARNAIDPALLARLSALLPDSVDNVGIILDLNALAARNGLALSDIDVTASVENPEKTSSSAAVKDASSNPVRSVDLSLSAVGTYAALNNFLVGVEKSMRLLDVRDILVKGSDTSVYTYQMTLRLYWLR